MATSWKYETVKHKQILVSLSLQPAVEPASHHTSPAAHSTGTGVWQGGARNIYTMIYDEFQLNTKKQLQ